MRFARRAAEQRVDGYTERLRLHIEAGILDRGDHLIGEAAGRELRHAMERGADLADSARIHAGDDRGVARNERADAAADAEIVDVFRPADEAFIGGEFQEIEGAPAGIGGQCLDFCYLHRKSLSTPSLRGAIATKQSRTTDAALDCFASLAMTK